MRATRAIVLAAAMLGALASLSACGTAGGSGPGTLTPGVRAATARPTSGSPDPGGKEGY